MKCQDFVTSHMKRKHMNRHPYDLNLTLQLHFVGFNLIRYNSLDEWLRLYRFKTTPRRTRVCHVAIHLSDDRRS